MNELAHARNSALKQRIERALIESGWDVKAAASILHVHRTYLHRLIRRFGLIRPARLISSVGEGDACVGEFVCMDPDEGWVEVRLANTELIRFSLNDGTADAEGCPWRIDRSRIPNGLPRLAPLAATA